MAIDIAKAVNAAKSAKTRGPKKGQKRGPRKSSDGRKVLEKSGKFTDAVEADWALFKCPKESDFEDILHYFQTRAKFLTHELEVVNKRVSELESVTYEERNAEALKAKEVARDKAAMNRIMDEDSMTAEKLAAIEEKIAEMKAKMAAKALQS
jgi:hypothetical protein